MVSTERVEDALDILNYLISEFNEERDRKFLRCVNSWEDSSKARKSAFVSDLSDELDWLETELIDKHDVATPEEIAGIRERLSRLEDVYSLIGAERYF